MTTFLLGALAGAVLVGAGVVTIPVLLRKLRGVTEKI